MRFIDIILLTILILIEVYASFLIKNAVKRKESPIAGVIFFSLVGYTFYQYLKNFKGSFSFGNILWQVGNVVMITLISLLFFKEKMNKYQWLGLMLMLSGLLLYDISE